MAGRLLLGAVTFLSGTAAVRTVALGSSEKHFMEDYVASENFTKWSKKIGNLFKSCCCVRASDWKTYKNEFGFSTDNCPEVACAKDFGKGHGARCDERTWPSELMNTSGQVIYRANSPDIFCDVLWRCDSEYTKKQHFASEIQDWDWRRRQ